MVELAALARYRFEDKPEQAVREEWIAPLLLHLGYGGETLNRVEYGEKLELAAPFRRIGRQRVEIDYRPTVRGHGLWIIEAKAHGRDEWEGAISQAWLYATHPEVDVPFMMIADGARTAVCDTYKPDWDDPVVHYAAQRSTNPPAARTRDQTDEQRDRPDRPSEAPDNIEPPMRPRRVSIPRSHVPSISPRQPLIRHCAGKRDSPTASRHSDRGGPRVRGVEAIGGAAPALRRGAGRA